MSQNSEFTDCIANLLGIKPQTATKELATFVSFLGDGKHPVLEMLMATFQDVSAASKRFHTALYEAWTSEIKKRGGILMPEAMLTSVLSNARLVLLDAGLVRAFEAAIERLTFEMISPVQSYGTFSAAEILGQLCYCDEDDDLAREIEFKPVGGDAARFLDQLSKRVLALDFVDVPELDLDVWGSLPVRMCILGNTGTGKTRLVQRVKERMLKGVVYDFRSLDGPERFKTYLPAESEIIALCKGNDGRNTCLVTETIQPVYASKVMPRYAPSSHIIVTSLNDSLEKTDGWAIGIMAGSRGSPLERAFNAVFCDFFPSLAAFEKRMQSYYDSRGRGTCLFAFQGKLYVWYRCEEEVAVIATAAPKAEHAEKAHSVDVVSTATAATATSSHSAAETSADVKHVPTLVAGKADWWRIDWAAVHHAAVPYHCPVAKFTALSDRGEGVFELAPSCPKVSIQLMKTYFSLRDGLCPNDLVSLHDSPWNDESKSQLTICRIVDLPSPDNNAFVMRKVAVVDAMPPSRAQ